MRTLDEGRGRHFYIASALENIDRVRVLAAILRERGMKQTYDWTEHGAIQDPRLLQRTAEAEVKGVFRADDLIVLLPGKRGTHVELGMGIAAGCRVLLVGDRSAKPWCAFHFHPKVIAFVDVPALLAFLDAA